MTVTVEHKVSQLNSEQTDKRTRERQEEERDEPWEEEQRNQSGISAAVKSDTSKPATSKKRFSLLSLFKRVSTRNIQS